MEIIAMGIHGLVIIGYYCERRNMQKKLDLACKLEDKRVYQDNEEIACYGRELSRIQDQLIQAQYDRDVAVKENKQLRADIDCFRSELGLGPRLPLQHRRLVQFKDY